MGPRTGCWIAVTMIAVTICAVGAAQSEEPSQSSALLERPQWEYMVVADETKSDCLADKLNQLGLQGWELISADPQSFVLKRRIR